jgi:curved DNA-binding protein CbpA
MKDYYKILSVDINSSKEEIVKSFRGLAKEYHPDKNNSENAAELFREIFEAYEILRDETKRIEYNKFWRKKYGNIELPIESFKFDYNFEEEIKNAKESAFRYSKMPYEDFLKSALFNINFVIKKSPTIGAILMLFLFGIGFISIGVSVINSNTDIGVGVGIFLFTLLLGIVFISIAISDLKKLNLERLKKN